MKNLGWQMFFALLLADAVAVLMVVLHVAMKIVLVVGGLVFIIIALVMFFGHNSRERIRKREAEAAAKIAQLQDQVEEALHKKDRNGTSL